MPAGPSLDDLVCPDQQRRPHRQTYRRRGVFVFAFDVRLVASFDAGGRVGLSFLTSSTTSCHQCSAGPFSNPSSRPRVSANLLSWCQAAQSARVLHVPTITRRSGLSDGLRSCPPTQPGRFFAADRRVRIAVSHSCPASSFRCTWVTIVIIGLILPGLKRTRLSRLLDYLIRPQQKRRLDRQAERLRGLQVDDQLELFWVLDRKVGGLGAFQNLRCFARLAPAAHCFFRRMSS